jgi:hypothetical protein
VNAVMNLQVPLNVGSFLTSCKPVSFSRRRTLHEVSKYDGGNFKGNVQTGVSEKVSNLTYKWDL